MKTMICALFFVVSLLLVVSSLCCAHTHTHTHTQCYPGVYTLTGVRPEHMETYLVGRGLYRLVQSEPLYFESNKSNRETKKIIKEVCCLFVHDLAVVVVVVVVVVVA